MQDNKSPDSVKNFDPNLHLKIYLPDIALTCFSNFEKFRKIIKVCKLSDSAP